MKVIKFKQRIGWDLVCEMANITRGKIKDFEGKEISKKFKTNILRPGHSVIRCVTYSWVWVDIPYWVAMQLKTHTVGVSMWCSTQRSDITGFRRDKLPQDNPVIMGAIANLQAIINISKERLCCKASKETRNAWSLVLAELQKKDLIARIFCKEKCIDFNESVTYNDKWYCLEEGRWLDE